MASQPETVRYPFTPSAAPCEPAPGLRELAAKCPVSKVELPDRSQAWLVTGFREVRELLADPRYSRALVFAGERPRRGIEATVANGLMSKDPPEHTELRRLVSGAFTDRRMQALRPQVARIVDELIDAMRAGPRPTDLAQAFSHALPARVICLLLGVPTADIGKFHSWSQTMLGDPNRAPDRIDDAYAAMSSYIATLIADKRETPADDLITVLLDTGGLPEEELIRFCVTLLLAGQETPANMISLSFAALCRYPAELGRLRADLSLIPAAVEELLRYVVISSGGGVTLSRITKEEVSLGGVTIPAGATVLPARYIANRDPGVFDDPDQLDIGRVPAPHLGFGAGAHYCLGAQLARIELQEAFRGLLTRLPGLRMAVSPANVEFRASLIVNSIRELPVTWENG